jgi:uroporphyrinogen-III synthase
MTDTVGVDRYRRLFTELGDERARQMLDKLQIVALTSPETMRELESFLDRKLHEQQRKRESQS